MFGHVTRDVFDSTNVNTSKAFSISGDAKAFGGSIYAPGATSARLDFSFDGGTTWVSHNYLLATPATGFFTWSGSYPTYPLARFVATAGTTTACKICTPE
jgi:hypothetical protein